MTNGRGMAKLSPPKTHKDGKNNSHKDKPSKKGKDVKCDPELAEISLDIDPDTADMTTLINMFNEKLALFKAESDEKLALYKAENDGKIDALHTVIQNKDDVIGKLLIEIGELRNSCSFLTEETSVLKGQIQINKTSIENNAHQTAAVVDKSNDLEDRSRRNNIVFYNFPEPKNNEPENCEEKIVNLLEAKQFFHDDYKIFIDRAHRLGRKSPTTDRPRPIIVRFTYFKDKQDIIRNGTKLRDCNINMSEDFSKATIDIHKKLRREAKEAKELKFNHASLAITNFKVTYRRVTLTYTTNKSMKTANTFIKSFSLRDIESNINWYVPQERKASNQN